MNKKVIISLIIACLIGLVLGLCYYYIGSRYEEAKLEKVHPLCFEFEPIEGEISCQEAIEIAKKEFEGEIESIEKKYDYLLHFQKFNGEEIASLTPIPSPEIEGLPEIESFEKKLDIWLVKIKTEIEISKENLPEEIKEIIKDKTREKREIIIIDLHTGKIL